LETNDVVERYVIISSKARIRLSDHKSALFNAWLTTLTLGMNCPTSSQFYCYIPVYTSEIPAG